MNNIDIFSYITDQFIDTHSMDDEKFNVFIANGFIKNKKFDKAIQQLELAVGSSSRPFVSYLYLIAIAIKTKNLEKLDSYIHHLNKENLPKEVLKTLELILSNVDKSFTTDLKTNSEFEILLNSLFLKDKNFISWVSFDNNGKIESTTSINNNNLIFIKNIQKDIILSKDQPFAKVLGDIDKLFYEFEGLKLFYIYFMNKYLYFLGNDDFSINFILLKLKEK